MTDLIPQDWKRSLFHLREEIKDVITRWGRGRRSPAFDEDSTYWPSFFTGGGPLVEVGEADDELRVIAELPGSSKDDFKLEVVDDRLIIRGEKKRTAERAAGAMNYSEIAYCSFARSVWLPCEVDSAKAQTEYRNGVLRIRLPKAENARARHIPIT